MNDNVPDSIISTRNVKIELGLEKLRSKKVTTKVHCADTSKIAFVLHQQKDNSTH